KAAEKDGIPMPLLMAKMFYPEAMTDGNLDRLSSAATSQNIRVFLGDDGAMHIRQGDKVSTYGLDLGGVTDLMGRTAYTNIAEQVKMKIHMERETEDPFRKALAADVTARAEAAKIAATATPAEGEPAAPPAGTHPPLPTT
ncbi:hypothetical protein COY28_01960, partial [Candidatus Woesearchaeota archaeon CG_4_10_14_0_2_um_filter_57_5]